MNEFSVRRVHERGAWGRLKHWFQGVLGRRTFVWVDVVRSGGTVTEEFELVETRRGKLLLRSDGGVVAGLTHGYESIEAGEIDRFLRQNMISSGHVVGKGKVVWLGPLLIPAPPISLKISYEVWIPRSQSEEALIVPILRGSESSEPVGEHRFCGYCGTPRCGDRVCASCDNTLEPLGVCVE